MKWLGRGVVAAMLLASTGAHAAKFGAYLGGSQLYGYCQSDGNATCGAYIAGVADTLADLKAMGLIHGVCLPGNATVLQLVLAFKNYSREHPAALSNAAPDVLIPSIREAFPCH